MKTIKTIPLTSFAQERERERESLRVAHRSPKGGQWLTNRNDQLLIDYCRQGGES